MSGLLERIWIKRFKRGPMDPFERATLVEGKGIKGNSNQGGRRQVTLIEREIFEEIERELGVPVDPIWRRANLLVSNLPLIAARGRSLRIGGCRLEILGETRPCERMDETLAGLTGALSPAWRGGAFAKVVEGGEIAVGDLIEWI